MSCYMVPKAHIDAIVDTAIYGPEETTRQNWFAPHLDIDSTGEQRRIQDGDEDALGDMLIRENLSSVHARYPDTLTDPSSTPGPCSLYWARPYGHSRPRRSLKALEAIKAIDCLVYQSCEHPEWDGSTAQVFLTALSGGLTSYIPGYDDAAWEIEDVTTA